MCKETTLFDELGVELFGSHGTPPTGARTTTIRVYPSPVASREQNLPYVSRYGEEPGLCGQFIHQCSLIFDRQPCGYSQDSSKITLIVSLVIDQASSWAATGTPVLPGLYD